MFRTTFLTGEMRTEDGEWYHTTCSIDDSASTIDQAVKFATNPGGIEVEVTAETLWKTGAGARHRKMAAIRSDGRRSAAAASMFYATDAAFTIRNRKTGKTSTGRNEDTLSFIDHMLAIRGDKEWHGETRDDCEKDAGIIRAFLAAQE